MLDLDMNVEFTREEFVEFYQDLSAGHPVDAGLQTTIKVINYLHGLIHGGNLECADLQSRLAAETKRADEAEWYVTERLAEAYSEGYKKGESEGYLHGRQDGGN